MQKHYSSGYIQIKSCWCPVDPHPTPPRLFSYIKLPRTLVSRALAIFFFLALSYLDFLLPYTASFDDKNGLSSLVFKTLKLILSVFCYNLNNISTCFII